MHTTQMRSRILSCRRFLARPFHPPGVVVYSFLVGQHFLAPNIRDMLEIGCGIGVFAIRFATTRPASSVLAIDHSKQVVEYLSAQCKPLFSNLSFATVDFCDNSALNLGTFDAVYSSDVLEHVYDMRRFIEHAHRVLDKGGMAVINFPNQDAHGINHFCDTHSIMEAFFMFSDVRVYDILISTRHNSAYTVLRSLYERTVSSNTHSRRAALYNGERHGVDCFELSTCYEFVRLGRAKNTAANIMSELLLLAFRPTFEIRPITGSIRNRDRLVIVAKK